jgi:hypothetical protein
LTASGARYYHRGSDKHQFCRLQNEGGGFNANQATICSLSDVAEAIRIFSDLDFRLHLSGEITKYSKSRTRFNDEPDHGKEFRGND